MSYEKSKLQIVFWNMVIAVMVSTMLFSCTTTKTVTQKEIEYRTRNVLNEVHDTLIQHDSVYQYVNGDSVYIYKTKNIYHAVPTIKVERDTILKTDTLYQTCYTNSTEESKNKIPWWIWLVTGGVMVWACVQANKNK